MVNIEKEACPEKKDFLWRERIFSVSLLNIVRRFSEYLFKIVHTLLACIVYVLAFTHTWPPVHRSLRQRRYS